MKSNIENEIAPTWYTRKNGGPHDQATIADEETGETIAVVYTSKNSPLLAAAPDLLAALKTLLAEAETAHSDVMDYSKDELKAIDLANAAILKATEVK